MPKFKLPAFLSKHPKRTLLILLAVGVLIGAGGYAYYRAIYLPAQTSTEPTLKTASVRQGDLVIYASGSGTLSAASETSLAFKTSGQVTGIFFKVGDKVEAGDLLAQVDDKDAQIAYTQAKRTLAELTSAAAIANAQEAIAQADIDLGDATGHLAYLISPAVLRWETEVEKAEQAVAEAQTAVNASPADKDAQQVLQEAQNNLEHAKASLAGVQTYYINNYLPNNFMRWDKETGKKYVAAPSEAEILQARAAVASAQAALEEARYLYAALTGGDVPESATGSSLNALEQAQLDLEAAQAELDDTRLYAPTAGTIMSINMSVGDTVSSSNTVITLADLSQPMLEVYLDESDWVNIAVGYPVEVTFDILPEEVFTGKVTQVDPGLYTSGNTSVIRALVKLDDISNSFNLPLGTSASVDVIAGRAENAILVPVEALRQAGDQYAVFVMENGELKLRVVEIGIQDLLYAEIISGLQPGDVVSTGITETQ